MISPTRESPLAGELKDAISQIINYLEEANIYRQALRDTLPLTFTNLEDLSSLGEITKYTIKQLQR